MERIQVKNLSKKFESNRKQNKSFLGKLIEGSYNKSNDPKSHLVLDNLSFSIFSSEIVGLIGSNGTGKSSLLRTIAGIYSPDSGTVTTKGKIISLINLNIGLQDRLTLEENVYLSCAFFGLNRKAISKKIAAIAKFAELTNYTNTKVFKFSEGMKQRLSFSIGIHCEPEILLLDEVFAVGDARFKTNCAKKIFELVKKGGSVFLASNEMDTIISNCTRVIWLKDGKIHLNGPTNEVVSEYVKYYETMTKQMEIT